MNRSPYLEDHPELAYAVYGDERGKDDDSQSRECVHCRRMVRWIRNTGGRWDDSQIAIVARPVMKPAWFDAEFDGGLIAVFWDRTGFATSRFTRWVEIKDAWLYTCHWDVCPEARAERDRRHQDRLVLRARVEDAEVQP